MAVALRLSRGGSKKRPFFRIVAADVRAPRDGRYLERLGTYNPMKEKSDPERVTLNKDRIKYWLSVGAKPTERVQKFLANEKLAEVYGSDDSIFSSFDNANDVLRGAVKGIAEIITIRGHINVDFADVKTVMSGRGKAMMGSAVASGDNRATEAVEKALSSPLLDNMHLKNATGVLCNITAGADLKQSEFNLIGQKVKEIADEDATTIIGCIKEDENVGELRVTLIATGFDNNEELSVDDDHVNYQNPNNLSSGISNANINKTFTTNPLDNTNVLSTEEPIIENDKINVNDVEVPAFLRQQAD